MHERVNGYLLDWIWGKKTRFRQINGYIRFLQMNPSYVEIKVNVKRLKNTWHRQQNTVTKYFSAGFTFDIY